MSHFLVPEFENAWTSGDLVVSYLKHHDNRWPGSWEDLQSVSDTSDLASIERLRKAVKIDWQANVAQLRQIAQTNPGASIQVVTRLDGGPFYILPKFSDQEPNGKILRHLRSPSPGSKAATVLAPPPALGQ